MSKRNAISVGVKLSVGEGLGKAKCYKRRDVKISVELRRGRRVLAGKNQSQKSKSKTKFKDQTQTQKIKVKNQSKKSKSNIKL